MRRLLNYFLRGLVLVAPIAITLYVCWIVFVRIDGWLGLPIPGLGFVLTVVLITLVGFLGSSLITRGLVAVVDQTVGRLPFVRLLYTSTKDLLNAFVGEKRRFDKPVLVRLSAHSEARMVGFVTQESLGRLGLPGYSAVYFPQSYNFAGNLVVFPTSQLEPLDAASSDVMAFIVSGGVTGVPVHRGLTPVESRDVGA
ncbi:MAG TPA: DUF502 domain-containing protein [Gemmatimonadaceae bacterium]|nr:DUF502 domain-containing protein [Gemmatimonadaceae bacterium]